LFGLIACDSNITFNIEEFRLLCKLACGECGTETKILLTMTNHLPLANAVLLI